MEKSDFKPITDQWRDKFDNKIHRDIEITTRE